MNLNFTAATVLLFEPQSQNSWKIGKALIQHQLLVQVCAEVQDVYIRITENTQEGIILDVDQCAQQLEPIIHFARLKNPDISIFLLTTEESPYLHRISVETGIPLYVKQNLTAETLSRAVASRINSRSPINVYDHGMTVLVQNIREAISIDFGGEVVIRSSDGIGRIYFVNNQIAWIYIQDSPRTLLNDLNSMYEIAKDELKAVFLECRRTGANFADTLVKWQLVPRETMRQILLFRFANYLRVISEWQNVSSIFIPEQHQYCSDFLFPINALLREMNPSQFTQLFS